MTWILVGVLVAVPVVATVAIVRALEQIAEALAAQVRLLAAIEGRLARIPVSAASRAET